MLALLQKISTLSLFVFVFLAGCTSPPSPFVQSLFLEEPCKGSVVIFRATERDWLLKNYPASIYIDEKYFINLVGGEHVQVFLTEGKHELNVNYSIQGDTEVEVLEKSFHIDSGETLYFEIIPRWGEVHWIIGIYYLLPIPFPFKSITADLVLVDKEKAEKLISKTSEARYLKLYKKMRNNI